MFENAHEALETLDAQIERIQSRLKRNKKKEAAERAEPIKMTKRRIKSAEAKVRFLEDHDTEACEVEIAKFEAQQKLLREQIAKLDSQIVFWERLRDEREKTIAEAKCEVVARQQYLAKLVEENEREGKSESDRDRLAALVDGMRAAGVENKETVDALQGLHS